MAKRVFITGPYSRVGSRLVEAARARGLEVCGSELLEGRRRLVDLADAPAVSGWMRAQKPDWVFHTAAYTDVDGCERDPKRARIGNVVATENVARATAEIGARLVHISTDYVFDGAAGPYAEGDAPHPLGIYGKTKLESEEKAVFCTGALIVRICVPYDWNPAATPNFLMWLIGKLAAGERVKIVTDQWSTPTYIPALCEALLDLCEKGISGILHSADRDCLSRHDFALKVARGLNLNENLIEPCRTEDLKQASPRPLRSGLKTGKAEKILGRPMISVEEGIRRAGLDWKIRPLR